MAGLGGVIGTVLGWLGHHMGLRTDIADAGGSLHAKVRDVRSTLLTNAELLQKPRGAIKGSGICNSTPEFVTILSVTGKGTLDWLWGYFISTYGGTIRIYIDGTLMGETSVRDHSGNVTNWIFLGQEGLTNSPEPISINLRFKSSLRIDAKLYGGSNAMRAYWIYSKE